jgi:hypothetical protein
MKSVDKHDDLTLMLHYNELISYQREMINSKHGSPILLDKLESEITAYMRELKRRRIC